MIWSLACAVSSYGVGSHASEYKHQHLSLTLPAGWEATEIAVGSGKELIGQFRSKNAAGTSILTYCYRGMLHTKASTRIRGLNLIGASYPAGQELLKKPHKVKTNSGKKASVELWQGYVKVKNTTVPLISPMAVMKTKHCWLLMVGFAPTATGEQLDHDFLALLKTAR
jgi:hypothetical protein